jgi:hypothetical protein
LIVHLPLSVTLSVPASMVKPVDLDAVAALLDARMG